MELVGKVYKIIYAHSSLLLEIVFFMSVQLLDCKKTMEYFLKKLGNENKRRWAIEKY
jgi:hypothetical protein